MIDWIKEVFWTPSDIQTLIAICLVCAIGLILAKIKMGKISLGITFVFFVGIIAAHFGLRVDPKMLTFTQNFGLVLFIYALGVQVGPSFFPSLKKGGITDNLLSVSLIVITLFLCLGIYLITGIPITEIIGIMSGAVTNTPVLAAAQSTLAGIDAGSVTEQSNMALACAVAYPLGVVGMILGMVILGMIQKKGAESAPSAIQHSTLINEFIADNPIIFGRTIADITHDVEAKFVISRLWHNGSVVLPTSQTTIEKGDHLLIASHKEDIRTLEVLFGAKETKDWNRDDIDWNAVDKQLVSKRLIVTKSNLNGEKLGNLRLRNLYGINITRIDRSGVELLASPNLRLQIGDRLVIVGEANAIAHAKDTIGDEIGLLDAPNLISLFVGLVLGCIVGLIPIFIPGISMPIKLGLAGGPIVIGILMGAFGPRFRLTTYITNSASLLLRQLGIVIYLGCLGLASGSNFFETIINGNGWQWILLGALITILPVLIVGWLAMKLAHRSYGATCGMLCGSMANPMALDYLTGKVKDDSHNVSYATVYPLSMFLRIITAQILLLLIV